VPRRNSIVHDGRLIKLYRGTYALDVIQKSNSKETLMRTAEDRLNDALDAALEMTFPASDPIAVYIAEPRSEAQNLPSVNYA
jgi:hypothetical protein